MGIDQAIRDLLLLQTERWLLIRVRKVLLCSKSSTNLVVNVMKLAGMVNLLLEVFNVCLEGEKPYSLL